MAPSNASQDLISSMPTIVTNKILKRLTVSVSAKTSTLSRTWRNNWLSHSYLIFDEAFWKAHCGGSDATCDWQKGSTIITNILCHHHGRIMKLHIVLLPKNTELLVEKTASLSRWLSLLSGTSCPKKINLRNCAREWSFLVSMPSYIFHCKGLVKLRLRCFILNPPPYNFEGFDRLRSLELEYMKFSRGIDSLWQILEKCPCLIFLKLEGCIGMNDLVIDLPSLEKLIIKGEFQSIHLKKVPRLVDVSVHRSPKSKGNSGNNSADFIDTLARSCKLQQFTIDGYYSKFLAAGGLRKVSFNHMKRLCLTNLNLSDQNVFDCTLLMIECCPFVKDLDISLRVISDIDNVQHKFEKCDGENKLYELINASITGITGSIAELKLIEYVLANSMVLEKLFIKCESLDANSELKVLRQLIDFPRASAKARVACLDL